METETDRIVKLIDTTFDHQPWYGSSIMEILSGIPEDIAMHKSDNPYSIAELVLHMTSWRRFTTQRLLGNGEFEVPEDQNFPVAKSWAEALAGLKQSQQELLQAAAHFPAERLADLVPSKRMEYNYYTLLHGIVHHDVYHLAQIALLKKLYSPLKA